MPNHATPVVVYGFILTRFDKTGNYLPKRTVFVSHRLSFTHSRYAKSIFYGKCWLFSREHFFFHRHCRGLWKTGKGAALEKALAAPQFFFFSWFSW